MKSQQVDRRGDPTLGKHTMLNSEDSVDAVPLENIAASPSLSVSTSPRPSFDPSEHPDDPFASPAELPSSQSDQVVMVGSSEPPMPSNTSITKEISSRPVLQASESSSLSVPRRPPTPKPLGLPPPRTPPPPPSPLLERSSSSPAEVAVDDDEPKPTRWWHEWLCGCGEGPDRGGENQVGSLAISFYNN